MFCQKCGKEIHDEAVICVGCGCPTNNRAAADPNILDTFCQRLKINAIIWLVIGSIQILLGSFTQWFIMIVGALNIITSIQDMGASSKFRTNPAGILARTKPLAGPIITLVYNLVIGGVIGVAGSIYYLVAIRNYVLENEAAFAQMEAAAPKK